MNRPAVGQPQGRLRPTNVMRLVVCRYNDCTRPWQVRAEFHGSDRGSGARAVADRIGDPDATPTIGGIPRMHDELQSVGIGFDMLREEKSRCSSIGALGPKRYEPRDET
ncbi:hypothetical protein A5761_09775 [Mycolicibacterium setense]|uniref:hypothetical protein n=1 Tax=Mycolicibacterium setense TaxID=431269 RepID=UPI0007EBC272|nr:hypothetical protein [Mycolicibacterium setense]OBB17639.1 hypothetical protein A5761_09775 [Mycolicibacterium setense]